MLGSFGGVLVSKLLSPEHLKEGFSILLPRWLAVVARETSYECGLAMFVAVSALIVFLTRNTQQGPIPHELDIRNVNDVGGYTKQE